MSKPKYIICNGSNTFGIVWENNALGSVLVTDGILNIQDGLEIFDCDTGNETKHIDLINFILECVPGEN